MAQVRWRTPLARLGAVQYGCSAVLDTGNGFWLPNEQQATNCHVSQKQPVKSAKVSGKQAYYISSHLATTILIDLIQRNGECQMPARLNWKLAVREGFEPSIRFRRIHAFQACSLNRSDTSPKLCGEADVLNFQHKSTPQRGRLL